MAARGRFSAQLEVWLGTANKFKMSQNMYLPVTNRVRGQQHKKNHFHMFCADG